MNTLGQGLVEQTAAIEIRRGLLSLSGGGSLENGPNTILLGTAQEMLRATNPKAAMPSLEPEEFVISVNHGDLVREIDIVGGSDRGVLYGAFAFLRNLAQGADMSKVEPARAPRHAHPLGR